MAIAWVVEHHSDESEYCHGPFSNAFEALRACDDIEEMTTLYIANDKRTAVVRDALYRSGAAGARVDAAGVLGYAGLVGKEEE